MPNSMFLGSGAISQMSQFAAANSASVGEPIPSHYKMCPSVVVGRFRNRSGRLLERLTVAAESEKRRIAAATVFRDESVESVLRDLHDYIIQSHLR